MAELITVARPYAEAIFRLSMEQGTDQEWAEALTILACTAQDAQVLEKMNSPKVTQGAILAFLGEILGSHMSIQVENFVQIVLANRRFVILPLVAQLFEMMRAEGAGIAKAKIESAFAINNNELAALTTWLEKYFKQKIEAKTVVNPDLIGGIRVTVGDEVIDASIRGKLSSLAASLKS